MKQNIKFDLIFALVIFIFSVSKLLASEGNNIHQIEILNNNLSINVVNMSLISILLEIREKTGMEFQIAKEGADKLISIKFQSLPINKALKRIISNLSHAIIFDPEGKIQKLIITGNNGMVDLTSLKGSNSHTSSNLMSSELLSGEEMKAGYSFNKMIIEPPSREGLKINHSTDTDAMIIEPPSKEGLKINHSTDTDAMIIEPPSKEGLKITRPINYSP